MSRPSDEIFELSNRLYDAKLSGSLKTDELSKIIALEGDLFANKIKQGKVSIDEIESTESFITGFTKENKNNYFKFKHVDLDRASKMFIEGDAVALEELEKKSIQARPIFNEESYSKKFLR